MLLVEQYGDYLVTFVMFTILKKRKKMISEKLQNAINEQIIEEMWSANLYLA